jgi:hypothetical protein
MAVSLGIPLFALVYPESPRSEPEPRSVPETSLPGTATTKASAVTSSDVTTEGSEAQPTPPAISLEKVVVRLAAEADSVDRVWQTYKSECGVRVEKDYDFGREWFALLDRAAHATIDKPGCAPLRRNILQEGEEVRQDLQAARVAARRARVDQATETGLLRWHGLQWR